MENYLLSQSNTQRNSLLVNTVYKSDPSPFINKQPLYEHKININY